jgi:uncharacterized repeat protein (TIGR03803 family)
MMKLITASFALLLAASACSRLGASGAVLAAPAAAEPSATRDAASGYKVLASFEGGDSGANPASALVAIGGDLYGTTEEGGKNSCGVMFKVATDGKLDEFFNFQQGCVPSGIRLADKTIFGVTFQGGEDNKGTIYAVKPTGKLDWSDSFDGSPDGAYPEGSVILYKHYLYGVTSAGGNVCGGDGCGTVFKIKPKHGHLTTVYNFKGEDNGYDCSAPGAAPIAIDGKLYGTAAQGGAHSGGCVYSVTTGGAEQVIYSFESHADDGQRPAAPLINVKGLLIGTTLYGGDDQLGTVFSVTTRGSENVIYSFSGSDGEFPFAPVIDVDGKLYGTTDSGGSSTKCTGGCGTVFSLDLSGHEQVLHSFQSGTDGAGPQAALLYYKGKLYGTTYSGGKYNEGTVYTLDP